MDKKTSLKDSIYNALMEDIFSLEYLPGQIITEKEIIEKYACSKSPVREALQTLCVERVLRSIPRCGYEVVRLTMDDVHERLQFRYILEGGILKSRYRELTSAQLDRLEQINENCMKKSSDAWDHWEHNLEFHRKLLSFCGNAYAVDQLSQCMKELRRGYVQLCWGRWGQDFYPAFDTRNHRPLIDSLRARDIEGALEHLASDLNDFAGISLDLKLN